jgi:hypothetical protein
MFMDIKVGVIMNKQFYKEELGRLIAENSDLKKQILDLTVANAELKDKLINYNHYTPTDGLEVGNPEDYEDDDQLDLFDVSK